MIRNKKRITIGTKLLAPLSAALLPDMESGKYKLANGDVISNKEFYCMPDDRKKVNPDHFDHRNADKHAVMSRNSKWSKVRRSVANKAYSIAMVLSIGFTFSTSLIVSAISHAESGLHSLTSSISSATHSATSSVSSIGETKEQKLADIKQQANDLKAQAKAHQIDEATFNQKAQELTDKYNAILKGE
ncbi:hypothetical protein LFL96_26045 [Paraburkholderia sp. D15]|uniref:hypothetical protein n=1 Tax=Paraburkholderia sp. D15 TaxID=2880218 RepID=UPI00247987A8|nr:hypothetical protein [Paraburkholderia sp. D15]WGS54479.1 hypothetical protein LFL96_26045 [Paraburkholderia sp. D15]